MDAINPNWLGKVSLDVTVSGIGHSRSRQKNSAAFYAKSVCPEVELKFVLHHVVNLLLRPNLCSLRDLSSSSKCLSPCSIG